MPNKTTVKIRQTKITMPVFLTTVAKVGHVTFLSSPQASLSFLNKPGFFSFLALTFSVFTGL